MTLTSEQIANAIHCPLQNVQAYWPMILLCLDALKINDDLTCVAVLATIAVETAHKFKPIHEYGSDAKHEEQYHGRLGNTEPGDGARYAGRGFIQITGKVNYQQYSKLLGTDMIDDPNDPNDNDDPEKADSPYNAAVILAAYCKDHGVADAARAQDWKLVRQKVNGGLNGFEDFQICVNRLLKEISNG